MTAMPSQITSFAIVYSIVYWGADQWKHQSSASLAFMRGIHQWPVNSPHKWSVTRKMFPFDDVIMLKPFACWWTIIDTAKVKSTVFAHWGRLNIKMSSYRHRDSHVKDKTVARPSYLEHGYTHTWKNGLYIETEPSFFTQRVSDGQ